MNTTNLEKDNFKTTYLLNDLFHKIVDFKNGKALAIEKGKTQEF